jgi:FkbM family methyltransferase
MAGLIHVGAWEGREYVDAPPRRLLLFEPQARPFAALAANLGGRPDCWRINAAASSAPGRATMYRLNQDHSSSLLHPGWLRPGFALDGEETVRLTTVDETVALVGGDWDEMVLDTQGWELEALKGAARTLEGIRTVEVEVHDPTAYPGAASLGLLDDYLDRHGFRRASFTSGGDDLGVARYENRRLVPE